MRTARAKIGDRATSNVVVRLRTPEGRDEWLYCHSDVLAAKSKYFADRLSDDWPTCQILDSRYCVEVYCQESDLSSHVTALRLHYAAEPCSRFGVRGALGVLQAAVHLGCTQIAAACVEYLESAPWDEADEEILRSIPCLGPQYECVLARLRPIDPAPVISIFLSAFRHAAGFVCLKTRLKVVEVSAKVLEAIAFGNIVLPTEKRCHAVKVWTGFAGRTKPLVEQADRDDEGDAETPKINLDNEVWQGLESAIVSIVLTLPSKRQAEILSEWLQSKHVR